MSHHAQGLRVGILSCAALALGAACAQGGAAPSGAASANAELAGTAWRVVRFAGGDDSVVVPSDPALYTIAFAADGRVAARISCNRGHGSWSSEGASQLAFGPLALTRAMCPPDPMEQRLVRDWPYVRSYVMRDGRLYLALFADGGIYELEPVPEAQPPE